MFKMFRYADVIAAKHRHDDEVRYWRVDNADQGIVVNLCSEHHPVQLSKMFNPKLLFRDFTFTALIAQNSLGIIANNDKMPWHCTDDLSLFRAKTLGHTCIMGRKTYDAMKVAFDDRPFMKGREVIVFTSDANKALDMIHENDNVRVCSDLTSIWELFQDGKLSKNIFIIGGAQIYTLFAPFITEVHITKIGDRCLKAIEDGSVTVSPFHLDHNGICRITTNNSGDVTFIPTGEATILPNCVVKVYSRV